MLLLAEVFTACCGFDRAYRTLLAVHVTLCLYTGVQFYKARKAWKEALAELEKHRDD